MQKVSSLLVGLQEINRRTSRVIKAAKLADFLVILHFTHLLSLNLTFIRLYKRLLYQVSLARSLIDV